MGHATTDMVSDLVTPKPTESVKIENLFQVLRTTTKERQGRYLLIDAKDNKTEIPESVFQVLTAVAEAMAKGQSVAVISYGEQLTTQQAADLLGVSRPFLIGLVEAGKIPYQMVGTHRRVRMDQLLAYKASRDGMRRQTLKELRRVSEGLGLYDLDESVD